MDQSLVKALPDQGDIEQIGFTSKLAYFGDWNERTVTALNNIYGLSCNDLEVRPETIGDGPIYSWYVEGEDGGPGSYCHTGKFEAKRPAAPAVPGLAAPALDAAEPAQRSPIPPDQGHPGISAHVPEESKSPHGVSICPSELG